MTDVLSKADQEIAKFYETRDVERPPRLSDLYALHSYCKIPVLQRWPMKYPNYRSTGVYLILGEAGQLLYVGKANAIGHRLGDAYFKEDPSDPFRCVVVSNEWVAPPSYLATIAVSSEAEALALEQHLIRQLDPPNNTQHRIRPAPSQSGEDFRNG